MVWVPGWPYPTLVPLGASMAEAGQTVCQQPRSPHFSVISEHHVESSAIVHDDRAPISDSARRRLRRQKAQAKKACVSVPEPLPLSHAAVAVAMTLGDIEEADPKAVADAIQTRAEWLVSQLAAGGEARQAAVAIAARLATADGSSSRVVQLALASAPSKDAVALAYGLRGHVRRAIDCLSGNYVIQKIIETMPAAVASFVAEELHGYGVDTARSKTGCRVLCRLLEHMSPSDMPIRLLVEEILSSNDPNNSLQILIKHNYANYVIQHIIEFGLPEQKQQVFQALRPLLPGAAEHRNLSHVIEKLLGFCSPDEKDAVVDLFLSDPVNLAKLAEHESGCYVVKGLLRLPEHSQRVADLLRPWAGHLQSSKYGRRVGSEIGVALGLATGDMP